MTSYKLSYYPWITQGVDPAVIRTAVELFAGAVQTRLGGSATVNVEMEADIPQQIAAVASEQNHIALLNPLGYVFARRIAPTVDVVAVAMRKDQQGNPAPTYRSQIYTSKKTGIRDIASVKGRSIGFGVPFSTSNFLVPAALLKSRHRLFSASGLAFLGGHDIVARAVYDGKVDIGAGHDGVLLNLAATYGYGDADDRMYRLTWTDPIPSDPVVVNIPDATAKQLVTNALLSAGQDANVIQNGIAVFWGGSTGLNPTNSSAYDVLQGVLKALCLDQDDLLT